MRVEIWLKETSVPIVIEDATSTYLKMGCYCVYERSRQRVQKYPMGNVWRAIEEYADADRRNREDKA